MSSRSSPSARCHAVTLQRPDRACVGSCRRSHPACHHDQHVAASHRAGRRANRAITRPGNLTQVTVGAPLTGAQRIAAWDDRAPNRKRRQKRASMPQLSNACRDCGSHLPDRRRRYCETCRQKRWASASSTGRDSAAIVLARLRQEQQDPAHGGRAAEIRGAKNAAHQRAVRDWTGERPEPEVFRTEILPGLYARSISELVAATGLSEHYCSLIRLGKKVPHPRHWEAFARVRLEA